MWGLAERCACSRPVLGASHRATPSQFMHFQNKHIGANSNFLKKQMFYTLFLTPQGQKWYNFLGDVSIFYPSRAPLKFAFEFSRDHGS
jgi:hypothetical protein